MALFGHSALIFACISDPSGGVTKADRFRVEGRWSRVEAVPWWFQNPTQDPGAMPVFIVFWRLGREDESLSRRTELARRSRSGNNCPDEV